MRGILAVTGRELRERARVLVVAAVAGLAPFALPWVGVAGRDNRALAALLAAFAVTGGVALLAGASVLGRDLAEGRLSFFFARPLPATSIWGGKMLAALLLTLAALALSSAALWLGPRTLLPSSLPASGGVLLLALVALIGLAHAASVGYRSRSPWFLADVALAVLGGVWIASIARRVALVHAAPSLLALLTLTAVALTAAGAAQVAGGRTSLQRGHRVLSAVLWAMLVVGLAGIEAHTRWLLAPAWTDVVSVDGAEPAPQGGWSVVAGRAAGRGNAQWMFLADAGSGRHVTVGSAYDRRVVFAPSGRRAAWMAYSAPSDVSVAVLDLEGPDLHPRVRRLSASGVLVPAAVSPDGRWLAALERDGAQIVDLDGDGPPVRVPLPAGGVTRQVAFLDSGRVRLFHQPASRGGTGTLELLDVSLPSGGVATAARFEMRGSAWVRVSPDRARMLVLDTPDNQPALTLRAADGSLLATPVAQGTATNVQAEFLADGRIVILQKGPSLRLRVLSASGDGERAVDLVGPRPAGGMIGGEVSPGVLAIGLGFGIGQWNELLLVDVASARVVRRYADLRPVVVSWFWFHDAAARPAPGSPAARLAADAAGGLVHVDPDRDERRAVYAPGGH